MPGEATYRQALPADLEAIRHIRRRAIRHACPAHYTSSEVEQWAESPMQESSGQAMARAQFLVAELDGEVVGCGFLDHESGEIEGMFVDPDLMGRGIGAELLRRLEQQARELGLEKLRLSATLNAASFYRRCGFNEIGRSGYCSPVGMNLACVRMEKIL